MSKWMIGADQLDEKQQQFVYEIAQEDNKIWNSLKGFDIYLK